MPNDTVSGMGPVLDKPIPDAGENIFFPICLIQWRGFYYQRWFFMAPACPLFFIKCIWRKYSAGQKAGSCSVRRNEMTAIVLPGPGNYNLAFTVFPEPETGVRYSAPAQTNSRKRFRYLITSGSTNISCSKLTHNLSARRQTHRAI